MNFAAMVDTLVKNSRTMGSANDLKRRGRRVPKLKWEMGSSIYVIAAKILEFPFNPFDMEDDEFTADNKFKLQTAVSPFVRYARELYHSNEKYKKEIDDKFSRLADDVKAVMNLPSEPEIPTNKEEPFTNSEIAIYNSFTALFTYNDVFRNIKSKNGMYTNRTIDMTPYEDIDGELSPTSETLMFQLGALESALANKNFEFYSNYVNENKDWVSKAEEDKKDFVKKMSWGAAIIGYPAKRSILPVFAYRLSSKSKTQLEDETFDKNDRSDFESTLQYIADGDLIKSLNSNLGSTLDENLDYLEVLIDFPIAQTDKKDEAILESYKQKTITVSPKYKLTNIYPRFAEFFLTMFDYEWLDEQTEGDAAKNDQVVSFLTDYFRKNCYIYRPWSDERLLSHYRGLRQVRDFNKKFQISEVKMLENVFNSAGINIENIETEGEIVDIIEEANMSNLKQLTSVPKDIVADDLELDSLDATLDDLEIE